MAGNQYSGGMLGNLFSNSDRVSRQEDLDDEKRLADLAHMGGFAADRLATYQGADMAGKGLGSAVAAAVGKDPRTPAVRNEQAIQAAKAQVSALGFNPDDPASIDNFYKKVIGILQQQGLVAEAMAVAKEYRDEKTGAQKLSLQERELTRRESADVNRADYNDARITSREGIEASRNASREEIAAAKLSPKDVSRGPFKTLNLPDRVILIDRNGDVVRTEMKGVSPLQAEKAAKSDEHDAYAYANIKADMQRQINASAELYNHPGLPNIVGVTGEAAGKEDRGIIGFGASVLAGEKGLGAADLHKSVVGGTLLTGLIRLKEASKTGASGLGALSEKEGDKVQSAVATLGRFQPVKSLRAHLVEYIDGIMAGGARLDEKAKATGVAVIPLQRPALKGASGAAPQVPSAAPAAAAPGGEEWTRVNGKLQRKQ